MIPALTLLGALVFILAILSGWKLSGEALDNLTKTTLILAGAAVMWVLIWLVWRLL